MALIKNGTFAEDSWIDAADDHGISDEPTTVSLARWQAEAETLRNRNAPLGLRLEPGDDPSVIADDLGHFSLIKLSFPAFKDGRAYSAARILRDRYGYRGELRATGDVLRSQLGFMTRVGFNAFEVDGRITPDVLARETGRMRHVYQRSVTDRETVLEKRV